MRQFSALVEKAVLSGVSGGIPSVALTFHERRRTRFGLTLPSGEDVGIALPRATVLRDGDVLRDEAGALVRIEAAAETLSVVRTADPHLLTRAAYHLGNRHVPLQIAPGELAYLHDHVLDGMVEALGLVVLSEARPFEAEPGPYNQHGHQHDHQHDHAGSHSHDHVAIPPLIMRTGGVGGAGGGMHG